MKTKHIRKFSKKGGNCGCNKLMGGNRNRKAYTRKMRGGYIDQPSFPLPPIIPQNTYYPYNILAGGPSDPTSANMQPNSRLFPDMISKGGKASLKRKHTSCRRKRSRAHRGQKGGWGFVNLVYPDTHTLGSFMGSFNSAKFFNGGLDNPSASLNNPLGSKYTENSIPIS